MTNQNDDTPETINVCAKCNYPSVMLKGHHGTQPAIDGSEPYTGTAFFCVNCGRFFGWSPHPGPAPAGRFNRLVIYHEIDGERQEDRHMWNNTGEPISPDGLTRVVTVKFGTNDIVSDTGRDGVWGFSNARTSTN